MDNRKDKDRLRLVAKYTSAAFQMAAIIVFGALGGRYLDQTFETSFSVWTLVLTIVAVALALYFFIKDISK
ncbi:MAG: AtpZ/AtpI family protein [Bacteroidales bacterium]|nr:AtpZ/AtpI family protein [Bacteroidales bacterium]